MNLQQAETVHVVASCRSSSSSFPFTIPVPCQNLRVEIIKGRGNAAWRRGNNRNTLKHIRAFLHGRERQRRRCNATRAYESRHTLSVTHSQRVLWAFSPHRTLFKTTCTDGKDIRTRKHPWNNTMRSIDWRTYMTLRRSCVRCHNSTSLSKVTGRNHQRPG